MASAANSDTTPSSLLAPLTLPGRLTLCLVFLLVAGTLVVYEPSLHNGFVDYDDPQYITGNAQVQHGLSWSNVKWSFTTSEQANWHPLTWIALMTTEQLFGPAPIGYHLVNLLLHGLNVVLLFFLLQRATGFLLRSAIVAGLFALFPLNVEAVAWAVEIKSVLSTALLFLALFAYGWYVRRPSLARYILLVVLYALGLMAKSMMVTLPFALLLLDYWPLHRIHPAEPNSAGTPSIGSQLLHLMVEKIPLLAVAAADLFLELHAASQSSALTSYTSRAPVVLRIENSLWSYLSYLLKGIWPSHLAIIYPFPDKLLPLGKVLTAGLVLLTITALVWHYRQRRYLLAGWLWYLGILVPVIGIVQSGPQAMADRWAYVSFLGLFVITVWLGAELTAQTRWPRAATTFLLVVAFSAYGWVSHKQIGYWHDSYTVFSHALQVTKANPIAENDFGSALMDVGRPDLAMPHFENAIRFLPEYSTAHYNRGILLQRQNRLDETLEEYKAALAHAPAWREAARIHNNLAVLMLQLGDTQEALSEYNAALRIYPFEVESLTGRASVEYQRGELDSAQADFSKAFLLTRSPQISFWVGRILEDKGDLQLAKDAYQTTLSLSPDMNEAKLHLEAVRKRLQP